MNDQLQIFKGSLTWVRANPHNGASELLCLKHGQTKPELLINDLGTALYNNSGGDYFVVGNRIYFATDKGRTVRILETKSCETLIEASAKDSIARYGGFVGAVGHEAIYAVKEYGQDNSSTRTAIVRLAMGTEEVLFEGADFIAWLTIDELATRLAFCTWNHPTLPWEQTTLHELNLDKAGLRSRVIENSGYSIQQPLYSSEGILHWVSDASGWWNIWREDNGLRENISPIQLDCARHKPFFGFRSYALSENSNLLVTGVKGTQWYWKYCNHFNLIEEGAIGGAVQGVAYCSETEAFYILHSTEADEIKIISVAVDGQVKNHYNYNQSPFKVIFEEIEIADVSTSIYVPMGLPKAILVRIHGGPVGLSERKFDPEVTFWLERQYIVVEPNYRGSIGKGRNYRLAIKGQWGIVDTEDCLSVIDKIGELLNQPKLPIYIEGKSAGGFTGLNCLRYESKVKAAAIYSGVTDLELLNKRTHNLESNYVPWLVMRDSSSHIAERSIILAVEEIRKPVVFLHGHKDYIVPIEQSISLMAELRARGRVCQLVDFSDEGHRFKNENNIWKALETTWQFFEQLTSK